MTTRINHNLRLVNSQCPRTLDDLADMKIWVAWREEDRNGKPTKIPYDPNHRGAARIPTDPTTWGTRVKAERRWRELDDGSRGGIGIVLGDLGSNYVLFGIDLDQCLKWRHHNSIDIDELTDEIISQFDSYAEISPSEKGIKLFALLAKADLPAVQRLIGFDPAGEPMTRKTFSAGKHLEIAIDTARYYAVTDQDIDDGNKPLRQVEVAKVQWFIEQAGPQFLQRHRPTNTVSRIPNRDQSRSGFAFRFFQDCHRRGQTYQQACAAIKADRGKAGDWANEVDERQLQRTWNNSKPLLPQQPVASAVSAWESEAMEFPPLKYVVPEVIVEGLTLFAGKPKIGKSWLMLQISNAVATGSSTLGGIQCEQGDVLYCALEDNFRRLQDRMHLLKIRSWSKHLQFRCDLPRLDTGGLEIIQRWITEVERPRLVIIDTFTRARAQNSDNDSQYTADYHALAELQSFANANSIAVVVVHHQRKMEAEDPFDTVSGTLGLTGAADSILILRRDSTGTVILQARGRDLTEIEKAVMFDKQTCRWKILGEVDDVRKSNERVTIIKAMQEIAKAASPAEIATEAQLRTANVSKLLRKMARAGQIEQHSYGKYKLPSENEANRPVGGDEGQPTGPTGPTDWNIK